MISAILLFFGLGVSLLATLIGGLKHLFSSFALSRYAHWKQLGVSHNKTYVVKKEPSLLIMIVYMVIENNWGKSIVIHVLSWNIIFIDHER